MKTNTVKGIALAVVAFSAGVFVANMPRAIASVPASGSDLAKRHFLVSLDEVRQNLAFGDEFSGRYSKTVTMSDGSTRNIELEPMLHDGMQVVALKDTGGLTYMALNGTTTNGKLMIQVRDLDSRNAELTREGWHKAH